MPFTNSNARTSTAVYALQVEYSQECYVCELMTRYAVPLFSDLRVAVPKGYRYHRNRAAVKEQTGVKLILAPYILFPGYILVSTDEIDRLIQFIRSCNLNALQRRIQINSLLRQNCISKKELHWIDLITTPIISKVIMPRGGSTTTVLSGPLLELQDYIDKRDIRKHRVRISLPLLGETASVWLPCDIIRDCDPESMCQNTGI